MPSATPCRAGSQTKADRHLLATPKRSEGGRADSSRRSFSEGRSATKAELVEVRYFGPTDHRHHNWSAEDRWNQASLIE
jgi:hypothetical protein